MSTYQPNLIVSVVCVVKSGRPKVLPLIVAALISLKKDLTLIKRTSKRHRIAYKTSLQHSKNSHMSV